ncbi:MAG: M4 family metallopeptidase [Bacteroidota bacterium]|nr:M4 family metallopeptidase [Bacteroidota bacterium]
MKSYYKLFLILVIPFLGFINSNPGIKSSNLSVKFYYHNTENGLRALESKVGHKVQIKWSENNSTPTFVSGKLTQAGFSYSSDKADDGIRFLSENKDLFGLREPAKELKVISNITDEIGMTHIKYQQQVNGVKIFHGQLIAHFNSDGAVESVNGRYYPTPDINTIPSINIHTAIQIAKDKLGSYQSTGEQGELNIYSQGPKLLLVYAVALPSYSNPMMTVFVDALNGEVIKIDDGIRYDGPAVGSGVALDGTVKTVHSYLSGGTYYMIDASLPMYVPPIDSFKGVIATIDAQNDTSGNGYGSAVYVSDPDNNNNFNDNERLKAAVSAHFFSREVYQFFKTRYNRNSYNNTGGSLRNVVHYFVNLNNAFWNGVSMSYGDGDGVTFSNLAGALDVIAHELTHGVTQYTADLVYELQPGALHESFSDVFGAICDSADWLIGEDVFTPGINGDALRSMQDPHMGLSSNDPRWQPAHMDEYVVLPNDPNNDNGGVHINSGIPNKAFYNVATAIGRSKAGLIWYRALTVYLTKNSQFIDCRNACLNSAKDLFGQSSIEYDAVASGFSAVGVGSGGDQTHSLTYDDDVSSIGVYEQAANWELAVKFTPPVSNVTITNVKVEITGDNAGGTGHFTLKMYRADGANGLPGTQIITPYSYTPAQVGWQSFDITGANVNGDFYVSVLYDGTNQPLIGGDLPPGNQRAYEYNSSSWSKLNSPDDYTLFMRASVTSTTGVVEIDSRVPPKFELAQNYPNPFNPSTMIRYQLPVESKVTITVYNMLGQVVKVLADEIQSAGYKSVEWDASGIASGLYFYRLQTLNFTETKKLLLLK